MLCVTDVVGLKIEIEAEAETGGCYFVGYGI